MLLAILLIGLMLDTQVLWRRNSTRPTMPSGTPPSYRVVVPIWGSLSYFKNRQALSYLGKNLVVVTVNIPKSQESELREIERVHTVLRVPDAHNASRTATSCDPISLMLYAVLRVQADYYIRLDGDAVPQEHPSALVRAMELDKVSVASVSVRVHRSKLNALSGLQELEYDMANRNRGHSHWMTSGACFALSSGSAAFLALIHSFWFEGEDLEIGILADRHGLQVGHYDYPVMTLPPDTWAQWISQRIMWWTGAFRLGVVNADKMWRRPLWLLYTTGIVWAALAVKLVGLTSVLQWIAPMVALYILLLYAMHWKLRNRWMILYPVYSLTQVLFFPLLGMVRYVRQAKRRGDLGRIR